MKRIITYAIAVVALASCSKSGIEIKGKIDNAEGQKVYLQQINLDNTIVVDSTEISNGSFTLTAPQTNKPTFYNATLDNGQKQITILTDSLTNSIEFVADFNASNWYESIEFTNAEECTQLNDIIKRVNTLQTEIVNVSKKELSEQQRKIATEAMLVKINAHKTFVHKYVFEHPNSFVSYYALFQNIVDIPVFNLMDKEDMVLFNTVATSLQLSYPEHERVKQLCDYILRARAIQKQQQKTAELMKNAQEVNSPDIVMPNNDGDMKKLSDYRGKVVILQFWASQDAKSRQINRQLVKLYEKYHSKGLEIYQISIDTSKLLWNEAVRNDKMTWTNVCDFNGTNTSALILYNVNAIPANYIIARDGSLVGKDLFGTRLDNKMTELFK